MYKVIAIMNQKGGVGKTTTAVTLAHGLALKGYKTLIIDLDTQGNVGDQLGIAEKPGLYKWLILGHILGDVITPARNNLDIIQSDKTTAGVKIALSGNELPQFILNDAIDNLATYEDYKVIILDCAPSVDLLQTMALVSSDYVIIPARMENQSIKGIAGLIQTMTVTNRLTQGKCKLAGILPTFYDFQTRETPLQLENLARQFPELLWPIIPIDARARVCSRLGKTLWEVLPIPRALKGIRLGDKFNGGYMDTLARVIGLLE